MIVGVALMLRVEVKTACFVADRVKLTPPG